MRHSFGSVWERRFRHMAANLANSAQELFGRMRAVPFAPPDDTPQRVDILRAARRTSGRMRGGARPAHPHARRGRD